MTWRRYFWLASCRCGHRAMPCRLHACFSVCDRGMTAGQQHHEPLQLFRIDRCKAGRDTWPARPCRAAPCRLVCPSCSALPLRQMPPARISHHVRALVRRRRGGSDSTRTPSTMRTVGQMPSSAAASRSLLPNWACVTGTSAHEAFGCSIAARARELAAAAGLGRKTGWCRAFRASLSGGHAASKHLQGCNAATSTPAGLPGSGVARCHTSFWCACPA